MRVVAAKVAFLAVSASAQSLHGAGAEDAGLRAQISKAVRAKSNPAEGVALVLPKASCIMVKATQPAESSGGTGVRAK